MPYDKFLIAPLKSGLEDNVKAWLISTQAFSALKNLYTWRGSVKKRFGSRYMDSGQVAPYDQFFSRLRVNLGMTDGAGDISGTVPGDSFTVGQAFSCANEMFTVVEEGTPGTMLDSTLDATTYTYDTTNGAYVIQGATPDTAVYFYSFQAVMAFESYITAGENNSTLFAFDTQFAYNINNTLGWFRVIGGNNMNNTWSGSDSQFFSISNFTVSSTALFLLFITNNNAGEWDGGTSSFTGDGFRYWDGINFNQLGTLATTPTSIIGGVTNYIITCKIIVSFKGRLLLLNTTEYVPGIINTSSTLFQNRVRYSQVGDPTTNTAWREDIPGSGGFINAPISDAIISVEFLKDRLLVFFANSTWELLDTGNTAVPFQFQKINTELGVESLNSVIPFDQVALGFGTTGIHACNGINVQRIDDLIPYSIFDVTNDNNGPDRVCGIRDYYVEVVYWSFNSNIENTGMNNYWPNIVLVYDYKNGTWAYNQDSITAFGNFYQFSAATWETSNFTWDSNDLLWADPSELSKFKSIVAGNQQGYTFIVDSKVLQNAAVLQITNITVVGSTVTIISEDHNLADDSYVYLNNIMVDVADIVVASNLNNRIFQISSIDENTFSIDSGVTPANGTYVGQGVIQRVSEIGLATKQYNFYNNSATNIAVNRIDFLVDRTDVGEVTVNWSVSTSADDFIQQSSIVTESILGTSILETSPYGLIPLEKTQDRFWHPIFFSAKGENFQFIIGYNEQEILVPAIVFADFQLNAFVIYAMRTNQFGS